MHECLSRRQLIDACEQERLRIARELHDDFAQRLASLAMDLSALGESTSGMPDEVRDRIVALSKRAGELGSDLHGMARKLHPATLRRLGLAAALRVFCAELSSSRQISITVDVRQVPDLLPRDVALCLYRVGQEALHNVARHSRAASALVTLGQVDDDLVLTVTDHGVGFDPAAISAGSSLGLDSMQERLRHVRGELTIQSSKGAGTYVRARVPLRQDAAASSQATAERRPRVLLADDYPPMLLTYRRVLKPSCEIVGSVSSGGAVLPAALRLKPDVIVLDVSLRDQAGLIVCRRVKQSLPGIGVVLVSAADEAELQGAAAAAGASSFLPKYSPVSSLVGAIRRAAVHNH